MHNEELKIISIIMISIGGKKDGRIKNREKNRHAPQFDFRGQEKAGGIWCGGCGQLDEQTVVAYTAVGELMIKGEGLHINKLSLETGELTLDGEIASLTYTENRSSNGSFFSKLFR